MSERTLPVLIAENRPQVRSALRLLLTQEPGVTVVGEAQDAQQVRSLVARQRPDLVLLDWELPGWDGPAALVELRKAWPGLAVIVLSGRPEARRPALAAGVDGFVSKGDPPDRLLTMVRACRLRRCGRKEEKR